MINDRANNTRKFLDIILKSYSDEELTGLFIITTAHDHPSGGEPIDWN